MNALTRIEAGQKSGRAMAILQAAGPLSLDIPDDATFEEWEAIGRGLKALSDQAESRTTQINWWIGDWWAFGEHRYGERTKLASAGVFGERSVGHLSHIGTVARRFETGCRHPVLSFTHYQEASRLEAADRAEVIEKAIATGMSKRDVRTEVVKRRTAAGDFRPAPHDGDLEYADARAIAQRWNRACPEARRTILDLLEEKGMITVIDDADFDQDIDP